MAHFTLPYSAQRCYVVCVVVWLPVVVVSQNAVACCANREAALGYRNFFCSPEKKLESIGQRRRPRSGTVLASQSVHALMPLNATSGAS